MRPSSGRAPEPRPSPGDPAPIEMGPAWRWEAGDEAANASCFARRRSAVATVIVLAMTLATMLAWSFDPDRQCETGFSTLVSCTFEWSSTSVGQSNPIFTTPSSATSIGQSGSHDTSQLGYADATSWAVAHCPRNYIARRLLCATPSVAAPAQAASDDLATGLPVPRPWVLRTAKPT